MSKHLHHHPEQSRRIALAMNQSGCELTPEQVEMVLSDVCGTLREDMRLLGYTVHMTDEQLLDFAGRVLTGGEHHA